MYKYSIMRRFVYCYHIMFVVYYINNVKNDVTKEPIQLYIYYYLLFSYRVNQHYITGNAGHELILQKPESSISRLNE